MHTASVDDDRALSYLRTEDPIEPASGVGASLT